jgi:F-type H+-transporting ATPase subunit a
MDLSVNGAKIFFRITVFGFEINITQTFISLLVITLTLSALAFFLCRNLDKRKPKGVQIILEKLVSMLYGMVEDTMGKHNLKYAPYIGTLFVSSIVGSLLGMTQIFISTTADLSVTLAWALVTTVMVWRENIKNQGFLGWLKGFTEPIFIMTPMNIVSEIAQPIALAFRHFGNVAGGGVLTSLITRHLQWDRRQYSVGSPVRSENFFHRYRSFRQVSPQFSLFTLIFSQALFRHWYSAFLRWFT